MLLWYDIVPEQIAEHDDWHTSEHFPERVAIPGFIRAQRWTTDSPGPRYLVVYEVTDVDVLSSAAYLERLNHPTPWTSRMMPHFRGMVRGFCRLESCHGSVLGTSCLAVRYAAATGSEEQLQNWLDGTLLPECARRRGFASAFLFRSDRMPEMTAEQQLRGRDATVDRVLLVTGYSPDLVEQLAATELAAGALEKHGAAEGTTSGIYRLACLADTSRD
jgi:hypothetical protein